MNDNTTHHKKASDIITYFWAVLIASVPYSGCLRESNNEPSRFRPEKTSGGGHCFVSITFLAISFAVNFELNAYVRSIRKKISQVVMSDFMKSLPLREQCSEEAKRNLTHPSAKFRVWKDEIYVAFKASIFYGYRRVKVKLFAGDVSFMRRASWYGFCHSRARIRTGSLA